MRLTPHVVSAARPKEKRYVLTDGHGLGLQVTPEGSKRWRFRYRFDRLENTISLGVYPKVGLAKARCLHADARGLLARGVDPSAERRRRRAENAHTFESVAQSWLQVLQVKARKGQHHCQDGREESASPTAACLPASRVPAHRSNQPE
jgi:hypothetical protein